MRTEDLIAALKRDYANAAQGEKSTAVHLFGIRFAEELQGHPINEIAERAGLTEHWGTEIRKGIRLSRYVELKR
jgi:hypothetical protein